MSSPYMKPRGTRFAHMGLGDRTRALEWARSHDWGEGAYFDDDFRMCGLVEHEHCPVNGWTERSVSATTMGGLRDWAGY